MSLFRTTGQIGPFDGAKLRPVRCLRQSPLFMRKAYFQNIKSQNFYFLSLDLLGRLPPNSGPRVKRGRTCFVQHYTDLGGRGDNSRVRRELGHDPPSRGIFVRTDVS